ncbi:MAG: UvrD-helicase domain-containing protein [Flavobacteriales bacterium]|nr:UvrD-helicase domain-containing protein [Flavobacteriales bacterium]
MKSATELVKSSYFWEKSGVEYLQELNDVQAQAVTATEGPVMIIAGAGSGKTRVLTYRIAHIIRQGIEPYHILALTFTNKAAREMTNRIARVIGEVDARAIWMGTFHSIFSRILRFESDRIGFSSNFTIYDTDDAKSLIKTIIAEMKLDDKKYQTSQVYNRISSAKNQLISATKYAESPEWIEGDKFSNRPLIAEIYKRYAHRCARVNAMDFDDLLLRTNQLFASCPNILEKYQQRFKYILVDEFQDTNLVQYAIIKQLSIVHKNICVVGDDAQSIYAFRGANIENILNFEHDFPTLRKFFLEQNYRSTQNIVEAANSVIAKNTRQHKKNVWTGNQEGNKIKLFKATSDNEEGFLIAQQVFENKMNHHRLYTDFAILYRTNAQSRALEEALRRLNIPYRIYGGTSFYQRKEIKDLLAYFRIIINPNDDEALKRIINFPTRGIGKTTLDKILEAASDNDVSIWTMIENLQNVSIGISPAAMFKINEFRKMIRDFSMKLTQTNAFDLATVVASQSTLLTDLYKDKSPEGVSRYENIQELLNAIKEFSEGHGTEANGTSLAGFMEEIALMTDADNDKDQDKDRVVLMTVHAAKGLEFPYVFVTGMEEGLFPSQMSYQSRDDLEEERRLFYVALTRAMQQLTLSYAANRFKYGQPVFSEPSRFLFEINPACVEMQIRKQPSVSDKEQSHQPISLKTKRYIIPANSALKKPVNKLSHSSLPIIPLSELKIGMDVFHERFGEGTILTLDGILPNQTATIRFDDGEKRLLLKYAKLLMPQK